MTVTPEILGVIIAAFGGAATFLGGVAALNARMMQRIDSRFDQVDARFTQVDARFAQVDARFDQVDARFAQVDTRFDRVDARVDRRQPSRGTHATHVVGGHVAVAPLDRPPPPLLRP